jgi:hypothetical protein
MTSVKMLSRVVTPVVAWPVDARVDAGIDQQIYQFSVLLDCPVCSVYFGSR